jgi:general secretion pathway protein M
MALLSNPIQDKWQAMSARDRLITTVLLTLVSIVLIYVLIWMPGQQARQRLTVTLQQKNAQLQQMKLQAAQIGELQRAVNLAQQHPQDLKTTVETSARLHNITNKITSIQSSQDGKLALSLSTSFAEWVSWVDKLQSEHHIRVERCHIEPANGSNGLTIQASLVAAAAIDSASNE